MKLRGTLLLGLPATLAVSLYAGHIFSGTPYIPPVTDDTEWSCLTDAECAEEARRNWLIDTESDRPDYASKVSEAAPSTPTNAPDPYIGDDNRDGHIDEDESGWDCTTMGNLICGPGTHPDYMDADPSTGTPADDR